LGSNESKNQANSSQGGKMQVLMDL